VIAGDPAGECWGAGDLDWSVSWRPDGDIATMTAVVLGVQFVFLSFYLSAVATE
jgi:hypothetical protein